MSALRPEADIWAGLQHVCFAETRDMIAATKMKEAAN
jgi:hypothetical protein